MRSKIANASGRKQPKSLSVNDTIRRLSFLRARRSLHVGAAFARYSNSLHDTIRISTTKLRDRKAIFIIRATIAPLDRNCHGACTRRHGKSMSFITPLRRDVFEKIWPSFQIVSIGLYYCRSIFCNAQIDILINGYTRTSCTSPLGPN